MTPFVTSFERLARDEGKIEGERKTVLRQLKRKLGGLSEALEAEVVALHAALLDPLSEALLDFTTQADLEAWLREHEQA